MATPKPLPIADEVSEPYWAAAREGMLVAPRCDACGTSHLPPRSTCPECLGRSFAWEALSGRGEVHTFTVVRQAPISAFAEELPYVLAIIQLEEGLHLMSNVVGCPVDEVAVGQPVEVTFDEVAPDVVLPRFTVVR